MWYYSDYFFVYRCGKVWQIVKGEKSRRDKEAIIRFDDHRRKPRI